MPSRLEYRPEGLIVNLESFRHRSSVVELSIRNRAVVGSNPTGGSLSRQHLRVPRPLPVAVSRSSRALDIDILRFGLSV